MEGGFQSQGMVNILPQDKIRIYGLREKREQGSEKGGSKNERERESTEECRETVTCDGFLSLAL